MTDILSQNLKRFRIARSMTQEQAADRLGVSAQSISRWECGASLPDATLLPAIARLYAVTLDDLYRHASPAYDNYAQRLAAQYETTHAPEDFFLADAEFRRLQHNGFLSAEDLRLWGILHQQMMLTCRDRAQALYDQALTAAQPTARDVYWHVRRQLLSFQAQTGHAEEALARQQRQHAAHPHDENEWICLALAYQHAGQHEAADACLKEACDRFPNCALMHTLRGDSAARMGRHAEAFHHWQEAYRLDPACLDALYAIAECHEQLGDHTAARSAWEHLADELRRRGFDTERLTVLQRIQSCAACPAT